MHTLFSPGILSPGLQHTEEPNPFELVFYTPATHASSSNGSIEASPSQIGLLTQRLQNGPNSHQDTGRHPRFHDAQVSHRRGNPKFALMGHRNAGKTSIQRVVFQKLSPSDALFLSATNTVVTTVVQSAEDPTIYVNIPEANLQGRRSFINIEIAEIPPSTSIMSPEFDHDTFFNQIGAVIWILDMQEDYHSSITDLLEVAVFLSNHHPRIELVVFAHKIDGLGDDYKQDTFRDVRQRVQDELSDLGYGDQRVSYYQTTIFDHSIFEAMSKVIQKLLPQLPALEALLTKLCSACRIQKAYLFDTVGKIYLATDASPTFLRDFEVCSDYIDVVVDIKEIYRLHGDSKASSRDGKKKPMEGESVITADRSGDTYIYVKEINEFLSLVCLMGKGSTIDKRALIDYNATVLQDAVLQIFKTNRAF